LVYKPGVSPLELINTTTISRVSQFFSTIRKQVRKNIKNKKLIKILEFPVLFLGAKPSNTPAFYNFMNYADFGLGTWHPRGGMYTVIEGMVSLAESLGVKFKTNANVEKILTDSSKSISGLIVNGKNIETNLVLSGADYHHTETLLDVGSRQYSEKYWNKKTFAPSSLLFYVGFDKKIANVSHHTLFFDTDFDAHAKEIYDNPTWPSDPLFYANFTSLTDVTSAPEGKEAGFFLIPLAPGIEDTPELREEYFYKIMDRFEKLTNQKVTSHVLFKKSFCVNDFKEEYNSYKGNAYGMANTLLQTAFLRPKIKSSKVKNLYFAGQLTVPGPGVPPALISGKLASELIIKNQF
jgi:phytoene desaturase